MYFFYDRDSAAVIPVSHGRRTFVVAPVEYMTTRLPYMRGSPWVRGRDPPCPDYIDCNLNSLLTFFSILTNWIGFFSWAANHIETLMHSWTFIHQILVHPFQLSITFASDSILHAEVPKNLLPSGSSHPTWSAPSLFGSMVTSVNWSTTEGSNKASRLFHFQPPPSSQRVQTVADTSLYSTWSALYFRKAASPAHLSIQNKAFFLLDGFYLNTDQSSSELQTLPFYMFDSRCLFLKIKGLSSDIHTYHATAETMSLHPKIRAAIPILLTSIGPCP